MYQWYRSVISGERAGAMPALLRFLFEILSWFYAIIIGLRNFAYDLRIFKEHRLPVPVIEFTVDDIVRSGSCAMWVRAFDAAGL